MEARRNCWACNKVCRSWGTRRREGVAIANEAQGFSNLPHNLTTLCYERLHSSEKRILFSLLKIPRKASVQSGKNINSRAHRAHGQWTLHGTQM